LLGLRQLLTWLQEHGGSANLEEIEQAFGVDRGLLLQMLDTLAGQGRLQKTPWLLSCAETTALGEGTTCRGCPLRSFCVPGDKSASWGTLYRLSEPSRPPIAPFATKTSTERSEFDKIA